MFTNLEVHAILTLILVTTVSIVYFIESSSSFTDTSTFSIEINSSTDLLNSSETVPEISEKSEPPSNPIDTLEPLSTPRDKRYSFNYTHDFWPSPRAVNFVKALARAEHAPLEGRINHGKAIELLANRAQMSVDVFLNTDPITYTKLFMPSSYTPDMLIGSRSILSLQGKISKRQYLDTLRRHG